MDQKLKSYATFREGGTRIQLEVGRPTTMAEISVNVIIHKKEDDKRQFYFSADLSVQQIRELVCLDFFGEGTVNPSKYTFYKVDAFEEPIMPIRRVKLPLGKSNVRTGDLLVLKSEKDMSPEEKLKLSLHFTSTGLSEDSRYLEDIEICREFTLNDLKQIVMDLPSLAKFIGPDGVKSEGHMRVREKTFSGFFGRIFREANKTLKQHNVKDHSSLVIQILPEPEQLDNNSFILFFARRDITTKTYVQTVEVKFGGHHIRELKQTAREVFGIQEELQVELAKHVPHQFEWKWLDEDEKVEIKAGGKKKGGKMQNLKQIHRAGDLDVKVFPVLLKDGDLIGVRVGEENSTDVADDWQTEADRLAGMEFRVLKEEERKEREAELRSKKPGYDAASVKINLEDEDEEE
jgi:hypothetical protein